MWIAWAQGESFFVALKIDMPEGWHTYWQNPGDSGLQTMLDVQAPEGFEIGPAHWPKPERIAYDFLTNYGYESPSYVMVPVTAPQAFAGENVSLTAKASWLVCKEVCIPESAELTLKLPFGGDGAAHNIALDDVIATLPKTLKGDAVYALSAGEGEVKNITLKLGAAEENMFDNITDIELFAISERVIHYGDTPEWEVKDDTLFITQKTKRKKAEQPVLATISWHNAAGEMQYGSASFAPESAGAASADNAQKMPAHQTSAIDSTAGNSTTTLTLFTALMLAFAGGIVLNVMPCVLPVLSLKILSLSAHGGDAMAVQRKHAYAYTGGILATFGIIAASLILLQQAGDAVGWGFQLQSPAFVTALLFILLIVGMSLSGLIHLPAFSFNSDNAAASGYKGSFSTGILTTLLATPCTAPFMAAALGFALTQPPASAFAIFMALGLGLAFPFLLISMVPALQRFVPKPGAWMERVKEFFAFPLYVTAIWLVWVLAQQVNINTVALILLGGLALFFAAWLARGTQSAMRVRIIWGITAALIIALMVMVSGSHGGAANDAAAKLAVLPNSEPFSFERLQELRADNTPVFVNATAAWCITCKVNERVALKDASVSEAFANAGIITLVADWTNRDAAISDYLKSLGRNGVPVYAYYAAGANEPVLLPQVLTPNIVKEAVAK